VSSVQRRVAKGFGRTVQLNILASRDTSLLSYTHALSIQESSVVYGRGGVPYDWKAREHGVPNVPLRLRWSCLISVTRSLHVTTM
jgi:hypothetical protein